MIAVDSNILVHAHRQDSPWHTEAERSLRGLAEGPSQWAIPWPCVHEFLAVVTHPRIYDPPSTLAQGCDQVAAWLESPSLVLIAETEDYWSPLQELLNRSRVTGARIHDARIAAICLVHGVRQLWTADRDFSRFPSLKTRNPLVA
jgi:uncharacterized protein